MTTRRMQYVLITPARNEESFIEQTIQTVVGQTKRPLKWILVNDGSGDRTGQIIRSYCDKHAWMELVEMPVHRDRSFAAKAHCFAAAYERAKGLPFDVIGNLDADITFDNEYLQFLMNKFEEDPKLGVAGTIFLQDGGYRSDTSSFEGESHVAGGCQMFRRECFDEIGGYVPTKIGVDWIAVTTARMKGWKTRAFREKSFYHHRSLGTGERSKMAAAFLYGEKDYRLGWHPLYQVLRMVYQMSKSPIYGIALATGYFTALARGGDRAVSRELMTFHRAEQLAALKAMMRSVMRFKRINKFQVTN